MSCFWRDLALFIVRKMSLSAMPFFFFNVRKCFICCASLLQGGIVREVLFLCMSSTGEIVSEADLTILIIDIALPILSPFQKSSLGLIFAI